MKQFLRAQCDIYFKLLGGSNDQSKSPKIFSLLSYSLYYFIFFRLENY